MQGKTISHYRILDKLGEGGMGVVYKAEDTKLGRMVALKFLPEGAAEDEERRRRFLHEARAAAVLNHPNICTVFEIEEDLGFLAMEFIDGDTLAARRMRRPLPIDEALDIALQVCAGLGAAHAAGVIHRDIKSGNIMLMPGGQVKIMDFGLARLSTQTRVTRTGTALGTPAYAAPEVYESGEADVRSDIWSLGIVIHEMIAGQLPFPADSEAGLLYAVLHKNPEPLTSLRSGVPLALDRVVQKALAKNPASRYQHVADLAVDLKALRQSGVREQAKPGRRIPAVAAIALLAALIVSGAFYFWRRKESTARENAMQQVTTLADRGAMIEAYQLARVLDERNPNDPRMKRVWDAVGAVQPFLTDPPGADVYIRDYLKPESAWIHVGTSPVTPSRLPMTMLSVRVVKQGYAELERALNPAGPAPPLKLTPTGSTPEGMVLVSGVGRPNQVVPLDDFWLDRYETTNAEFKKFVDAGGYEDPKYWKQPFVDGSRTLGRDEAMARFKDSTGRPGPARWELGSFLEGTGNLPVTGVSWYEAAAYAEFAGKELPTVHHWRQAAIFQPVFSEVVLISNFSGKGLAERGKYRGAGYFGTYDMAGNAKEWCWNESAGKRLILGGAWSETNYMYTQEEAASPFERGDTFGIRCARYTQPVAENVKAPVVRQYRDYTREVPASDEQFKVYKSLYSYDRSPLEEKVESIDDTHPAWRIEKLTFNAAYGNERVIAYLYLPKKGPRPYQTVVHFPGGYAPFLDKIEAVSLHWISYIVQSGRALMFPIYKGTYERRSRTPGQGGPMAMRDYTIQLCKDISRSVDYLEKRPDIDRSKLAYQGISFGANVGLICLAIEERFQTAIFQGGGLANGKGPPESDRINFVPRIRIPVLLINGRNDFLVPMEELQLPLLRLLGSPPGQKRHFSVDGGHVVPRHMVMKESLDWLDRYLGPVSRTP